MKKVYYHQISRLKERCNEPPCVQLLEDRVSEGDGAVGREGGDGSLESIDVSDEHFFDDGVDDGVYVTTVDRTFDVGLK